MSQDILLHTAIEQAELIRSRQLSANELLDAVLEQIEETEPQIHAFVTICEEEARKKAREVDRKIHAGEAIGPLAGVPYSAKDVFCTKGIRTTAGSGILGNWLPPYNAAVIERMDAADAVLIGKTNCDEFAMGGTNEHTAFQAIHMTRNGQRVVLPAVPPRRSAAMRELFRWERIPADRFGNRLLFAVRWDSNRHTDEFHAGA